MQLSKNSIREMLDVRREMFTSYVLLLASHRTFGGGERVRTDGLLRARQALSQLSYTPESWWAWVDSNHRPHDYQSCALAS